jgi:uncharacterized protein (DUF1501 family)
MGKINKALGRLTGKALTGAMGLAVGNTAGDVINNIATPAKVVTRGVDWTNVGNAVVPLAHHVVTNPAATEAFSRGVHTAADILGVTGGIVAHSILSKRQQNG